MRKPSSTLPPSVRKYFSVIGTAGGSAVSPRKSAASRRTIAHAREVRLAALANRNAEEGRP